MKLSTRSTYGMRALVELALAPGRGLVSATRIAKRQDLSVAYLEQLLHRLKKQGLISSIRGPRGGYVLAKSSEQITMADVVRILDGINGEAAARAHGRPRPSLQLMSEDGLVRARRSRGKKWRGAIGRADAPAESPRYAQRIAETVWRCVHERWAASLGAVSLQDLCDAVRTDAGEPLEHRYVFHI